MASPDAASSGQVAPAKPSLARRAADEVIAILKAALWFVPLWVAFNAVAWAQYSIPSESMVPTMEVGDRVIVAKYAYGYSRFSLPLVWRIMPQDNDRLFYAEPKRADVVVFAHPFDGRTMIKRVMGLPGDQVEMRDGQLIINGEAAAYNDVRQVTRVPNPRGMSWEEYPAREYEETIAGRTHIGLDMLNAESQGAQYGPVTVPDDHFLMLGDNRDNSADGRFPEMGFVSKERLIGRAETVIFAPKTCGSSPAISCTRKRWLEPLWRAAP